MGKKCAENMIIETERLYLRAFTVEDAEDMYALNLDPDVMKYTGDRPFESIDAARRFLESYDQYKKYGLGRWAVILKESERFTGWCGLKYDPLADDCDIGFRFLKSFWGRGYATESALACLNFGFEQKGLSQIVGRAMKDNIASIRVLEKIGLKYVQTFRFDACDGVIYSMENAHGSRHPDRNR